MSCAVHARALAFSYPDGRQALAGLDLAVTDGERVALLGPNGAGKTTPGAPPERASAWGRRARGGGLDVADDKLHAARSRRAGVSGPTTSCSAPTVGEDVAFGLLNLGLDPYTAEARVRDALAAVRMTAAAARAPFQLSMGERRRVAIATVLAMHPRLLVLDEPSANLDPRARRELIEALATIDHNMLVATHDLPPRRAVRTRGDPFPGRRSCRRPQPRAAGRRRAACRARPRAAGRPRPGARPQTRATGRLAPDRPRAVGSPCA